MVKEKVVVYSFFYCIETTYQFKKKKKNCRIEKKKKLLYTLKLTKIQLIHKLAFYKSEEPQLK